MNSFLLNQILGFIILITLLFKHIDSCGNNPARIINGQISPNGFWPWIVSLQIQLNSTYRSHFCAGSLISPQYVLTAAHCVVDIKTNNWINFFKIKAGSNLVKEQNEILYDVSDIFIKEDFSKTEYEILNDIAIIKLSKSVELSSKISTICLPNSNDVDLIINKQVNVAGWGSTDGFTNVNSYPNNMYETTLRIYVDSTICPVNFPSSYCAFDPSPKNSNICKGDSGGPLMYSNNGKWYLFGIASFVTVNNTIQKCLNEYPSYFTKVPLYRSWIEQKIQFRNSNSNSAFKLLSNLYYGVLFNLWITSFCNFIL